jgi:hypothetical protein
MWGLLVGIYLAYVLYPFIYEWQQRRLNKERLRKMRENFAKGRRWDVAKGGWLDDWSLRASHQRLVAVGLKAKPKSFDDCQALRGGFRARRCSPRSYPISQWSVSRAVLNAWAAKLSPGYGKYKSYSYRFETPGRIVFFTGDTGPSDAVVELAHGADLYVTEVTSPEDVLQRLKRSGVLQSPSEQEGFNPASDPLSAVKAARLL